jgi:8-oxo-dGTP pyrophosphatase MutT (NUDIX family)
VSKRQAARLILLDPQSRVLLLHASDPADHTKPPWWEFPGGGIHRGESSADAAKREAWEETGIAGIDVGPCVWVLESQFTFGGWFFDQRDHFHVGWCEGGEWEPKALEALEVGAFKAAKWWDIEELLATDLRTIPEHMRLHLPSIVAGTLPPEPVDIGTPPLVDPPR